MESKQPWSQGQGHVTLINLQFPYAWPPEGIGAAAAAANSRIYGVSQVSPTDFPKHEIQLYQENEKNDVTLIFHFQKLLKHTMLTVKLGKKEFKACL